MLLFLSVCGVIFMMVGVIVVFVWSTGGHPMALLIAGVAGVLAGSMLLVGAEIIVQLRGIYRTLLALLQLQGEKGRPSIANDSTEQPSHE